MMDRLLVWRRRGGFSSLSACLCSPSSISHHSLHLPRILSMQVFQEKVPPSSLPFLNGLGIVGAGIISAFYAMLWKKKRDAESSVLYMKHKLNGKEAEISSLKQNYEIRFLTEENLRKEQVRKLKEDEASLLSQLTSANGIVTTLQQELHNEKKLAEEVKEQLGQLQCTIARVTEDKMILENKLGEKLNEIDILHDRVGLLTLDITEKEKSIEKLQLTLSDKESECKRLSCVIQKLDEDLVADNATIELSKIETIKAKEELSRMTSEINSLKEKIQSLFFDKENLENKIQNLMKDYGDLKACSETRARVDAEKLSKTQDHAHHLEEKLKLALDETRNAHSVIDELRKQRDEIKALLENKVNNANKLTNELQATKEMLMASKLEALDLYKELEEKKELYEKVMSEFLETQDEFKKTKELLTSDLKEAMSGSENLSNELISAKGVMERVKEELENKSREIDFITTDNENVKRELLETYKKLEAAVQDLKEERLTVSTLNKDVAILKKQMQTNAEARRVLEMNLDEATKSLDEMSTNALLRSKELENADSRTVSLEIEKEVLSKSLAYQEAIAKEAQENIEDAQNLIARLGSQRENLEKRSKRLEEELSYAKGEILRLRRKVSTNQDSDDKQKLTIDKVAASTPFSSGDTAI